MRKWFFALCYILVVFVASSTSAQFPCTSGKCITVSPQGWIVGEIRTFSFGDDSKEAVKQMAAQGWVECAGQSASRADFPELYRVVGDTWGSADGATSFYLPDLRGVFLRGWNHSRPGPQSGGFDGRDSEVSNRQSPRSEIPSPGTKGHAGDQVGSAQIDRAQLNDHIHVGVFRYTKVLTRLDGPSEPIPANIDTAAETGAVKPSTGALSYETRPRNVYVAYYIYVGKASGIMPATNITPAKIVKITSQPKP